MPGFFEQFDNFSKRVPHGDNRERLVCNACEFVHYDNPKIVVGSVVTHDEKVLMCRRAIEPRLGFWTLPAGFMENHETTEEGAQRECMEEACARIEIENLLAIYNIPRISQVQIMYKARLLPQPEGIPDFAVGPESQEVALVAWDDIPWKELAFPSVRWALEQYRTVRGQPAFAPFTNPEGETVSR